MSVTSIDFHPLILAPATTETKRRKVRPRDWREGLHRCGRFDWLCVVRSRTRFASRDGCDWLGHQAFW